MSEDIVIVISIMLYASLCKVEKMQMIGGFKSDNANTWKNELRVH